jgi:hypothetical protein
VKINSSPVNSCNDTTDRQSNLERLRLTKSVSQNHSGINNPKNKSLRKDTN